MSTSIKEGVVIKSGLVSITFRQLKPQEVVALVSKAGLQGIEWGGDIHVPHGDVKTAKAVCKLTMEAGLSTAAYGSYYRVGCEVDSFDKFNKVLETAVELKAPTIRVWAGEKGSAFADEIYRENVAHGSRRIAELAETAGITISFEYHGGTLTDSNQSAITLFDSVKKKNIRSYWQPEHNLGVKENVKGLKALKSLLSNIHVFHWILESDFNIARCQLSDGQTAWKEYFSCLRDQSDNHYAMLEFVKNDEPEQFLRDAKVLKYLIENKGI